MGIVFRAMPGRALANIPVEHGGRHRDGLLQRSSRLIDLTPLAECRGEPAIGACKVGVRPDRLPRRFDGGVVLTRQVEIYDYGQKADRQTRVARVEPNTFLESNPRFLPLV